MLFNLKQYDSCRLFFDGRDFMDMAIAGAHKATK